MPRKASATAAVVDEPATTPTQADYMAQAEHRMVLLEHIRPSADNPRSGMTDASLQELADSIREQGLIEPVVLRPQDDGHNVPFVLVVGERRWRASQLAQLSEIPAVIRWDLDRKTALELTIIENFQRQDLNPIDEAEGFSALQKIAGLTQKQIAERIGTSQPVIANRLRLLEMPDPIKHVLRNGSLSMAHGLALLRYRKQLSDEQLCIAAGAAYSDRRTVKEIEAVMPGLREMEEKGLSAFLTHDYGATNNYGWKKACLECPFNAMVRTANGAMYCLKPEHAIELSTAWEEEAAKQRETANEDAIAAAKAIASGAAVAAPPVPVQDEPEEIAPEGPVSDDTASAEPPLATDSGSAPSGDSEPAEDGTTDPEKVTNIWDKLPRIEMLPWGSYERLSDWNTAPGCTTDCKCRGLARSDTLSYPIPVCFDPKRLSALKAAATREANKAKAAKLEATLQEVRDLIDAKSEGPGWLNAADLAVLLGTCMRSMYSLEGSFRRAAERRGLELDLTNYAMGSHRLGEKGAEELDKVTALGAPVILQILLEGLFEQEVKSELAIGGADAATGRFSWWKEKQKK